MVQTSDINKINRLIDKANNIYIMGHRYIDLDAIASSAGIYHLAKSKNKKASIIINDKKLEVSSKKLINEMFKSYRIINSNEIKNINDDDLLIIVDTNKEALLQDKTLFQKINNVIIIDHHDYNDECIKKGLVIIDEETSSACEMITEILLHNNFEIVPNLATILLSGIVLDTNNFVLKTGANTYKMAYELTTRGAKPLYVQYLLKQNLKDYVARQKAITNIKKIKNVAISCTSQRVTYRREDLAKISDTLLQFNGIEASFVIGKLDNGNIGISARSMGKIDVGKILENFDGGGDNHEAGASIENSTTKEIEKKIRMFL